MNTPARFTPADARREVQENGALLLDVRMPGEFAAGHAEGAVLLPLHELSKRRGELPTDRPVIALCASGHRSQAAVKVLSALGADVLGDVAGGTQAWRAAGLPVETSPRTSPRTSAPPMPLERQVRLFAGLFVAVFSALGFFVHPAFHIGTAFVGVMLCLTAALGICPMMDALRLLPWNRVPQS